jgi:hypothetical protein
MYFIVKGGSGWCQKWIIITNFSVRYASEVRKEKISTPNEGGGTQIRVVKLGS